jgi:hypothetical protein
MRFVQTIDPANRNVGLRTGAIIADIEVDPRSGALYLAWEDSRFTPGHNGVVLTRSTDGGLTWTTPRLVNGDAAALAFTPSLAVTSRGDLGLSYYDLRAGDFRATAWLAVSRDGGASFEEEPLTGDFDLRKALLGNAYFLGDYQGLVAADDQLVPFFAAALETGTPTAIFTRPSFTAESIGTRAADPMR